MEQEIEKAFQIKLEQIIKAARDYHNNPAKAEEYIRRQINNIWIAGKKAGNLSVVNELFG